MSETFQEESCEEEPIILKSEMKAALKSVGRNKHLE